MKKPKLSKNDTKTLNMVNEDFKSAWDYAENNYHDIWNDCWKLYNNKRTSNQAYRGIANNFIPITFSTVEAMVSALAGSRPRFDYQPTQPDQETDVKILNSMLDYYWDTGRWQSIVDKWIRSMLMYGTGVMYMWWDIDRPQLEIIPLRDFFVDPTATSPRNARFMGRRYLTTKDDLESFEYYDIEKGKMKKLYKNLNKLNDYGGSNDEQMDKEEKEVFLGSTLGNDAKKKQVECIEYWTEDRVIVVANRSVVIRDDENPYKEARRLRGEEEPEGIIPFIIQRNYQDESLFYGRGDVEPIMGLQENLNDMSNQKRDAVTYALNPMFTLDPQYADYIETVESLPGAIYPFEAGALQMIQMGDIPSSAYNEEALIKADIRETTAADLTFKGADTDTDKTATEIQAQLAQANQRLALKVSQIENEGYQDLAQIVLSMVQIYVDEPQMIKVIGEDNGVDWEIYDPTLYTGEYRPQVQLDTTIESKKAQVAADTESLYGAFAGDPEVNQIELKRIAMQKIWGLEKDEIDRLLEIEPMEQMIEPQQDLMGAMVDPMQGAGLGF